MQVDTLGRYLIEKELGRGAMGQVFLAYDPQIERRVAIKTIQIFSSLPEADRAEARERFLREARSAGKLLHPGIVTIFDVGEADGVPYLAMEYLEGHTLDAFCRDDDLLPLPIVVALVASAAEALAFAHGNGIVHRDIKPANLMRVGASSVKVMDFGLAKSSASSMTHDGSLLGTPNYMSPEQIRGEELDGRSDLFSLAIVLYEMLTGEKPFSGDSVSSVLYRIVHESPRDLALHLDRVPQPIAAFLSRALAKRAENRFPDGKAFSIALRLAADAVRAATLRPGGQVAPAIAKASAAPPTAPPRRSLVPWLAGSALALAVVAVAAFGLSSRSGGERAVGLAATVRTEPPGLPVTLNGTAVTDGLVRFAAEGPFGVLSAGQGCREAKHRIEPADAGREIVLALDPLATDVVIDPAAPGARITVNGQDAGAAPATVSLDLCRDNTVEASAAGYRLSSVAIPAKATPFEARNAAAGLRLEAIPMGRLLLPAMHVPATFAVDGKEVTRENGGIAVPAGRHEVTAINADRFLEVHTTVEVPVDGVATAEFRFPVLGRLVVQTFPPNCRVAIKRNASAWRTAGETPLRYELAPGRYTLRVESPLSRDTREQVVDVRPGGNPPVRISFGRSAR
jgi:hypothetical protein